MIHYPPPPRPRARPLDGPHLVLTEPYEYWWWDKNGERRRMVIPAGFVWDQASNRRLLWMFVAPFDLGPEPPLLHDWPYRNAGQIPTYPDRPDYDQPAMERGETDALFLGVMTVKKRPWYKRYPAWVGVRLIGGSSWEHAEDPLDKDGICEKVGAQCPRWYPPSFDPNDY